MLRWVPGRINGNIPGDAGELRQDLQVLVQILHPGHLIQGLACGTPCATSDNLCIPLSIPLSIAGRGSLLNLVTPWYCWIYKDYTFNMTQYFTKLYTLTDIRKVLILLRKKFF